MNIGDLIARLSRQAERLRALVEGTDDEQARWKPDLDSWSILEVVNHLLDEEREDFRVRLDILLHRPGDPWPRIDPQGWVNARHYNSRDLAASLEAFLVERRQSLVWLRGLAGVDLDASGDAPWGEPITAGDMAAAWVSHDLLHMRQLVELQWANTQRDLAPYQSYYAGDW